MLHILWLALKCIGILLAAALALLLLLAALVLFCPLAYRVEIKKDADWRAWARVRWLFGLVSVTVQKDPVGFQKVIRICGMHLFKRKKRPKKKAKKAAAEENAPAAKEFREEESLREEFPKEEFRKAEGVPAPEESVREEKAGTAPPKNAQKGQSFSRRENLLCRLWTRIVEKCRGICDAFIRFVHTVRRVCGQISLWKNFLGDAHTKSALGMAGQQLLRLLRHAGPQKWKGHVNLGFENPAATGQALAALGAAYPIHKGRIAVNPVWDRAVLEGEIDVKGRVFGILLLHMVGTLYFDKDVKYVFRWFRRQGNQE